MTFRSLDLVRKVGPCIWLQRGSKAQPPYPCMMAQEPETDKIPCHMAISVKEGGKSGGGASVKDTSLRGQLCKDLKEVRKQPCSCLGRGKTRTEMTQDPAHRPEQRNEGAGSGR